MTKTPRTATPNAAVGVAARRQTDFANVPDQHRQPEREAGGPAT